MMGFTVFWMCGYEHAGSDLSVLGLVSVYCYRKTLSLSLNLLKGFVTEDCLRSVIKFSEDGYRIVWVNTGYGYILMRLWFV